MHGGGQGIDLHANLRAAAQGRGQGRLAYSGVARIGDEDGVGSKKLRAVLDELGQTLAAALLGALDEVLQVHLGAAVIVHRAQGGQVHGHIALAIGGAAAIPAGGAIGGLALGKGERIGFPSLAVAGRHHVIVGVEQHRLGAFIALALTQDGGGAIGRGDGFHAHSGFFQCGLNPLACALGLVLQTFLVMDGIKGHELAELAENGLAIVANAFIKCSHVLYGTRPPQAIEQPE